jgi:hypothetical protein
MEKAILKVECEEGSKEGVGQSEGNLEDTGGFAHGRL